MDIIQDIISGKEKSYECLGFEYKDFASFVESNDNKYKDVICISSVTNPGGVVLKRYYTKGEFVQNLSEYQPDNNKFRANFVWILKGSYTQEDAELTIKDIKALPGNWKLEILKVQIKDENNNSSLNTFNNMSVSYFSI